MGRGVPEPNRPDLQQLHPKAVERNYFPASSDIGGKLVAESTSDRGFGSSCGRAHHRPERGGQEVPDVGGATYG